MRAVREILRQRYHFHRSIREISQSVGMSYGAVQDILSRVRQNALPWPLPDDMGDAELNDLRFPPVLTS